MDSAAAGGSNILERLELLLLFALVLLGQVSVAVFMVSVVAGKRCLMVSVVGFFMVAVVARNVF